MRVISPTDMPLAAGSVLVPVDFDTMLDQQRVAMQPVRYPAEIHPWALRANKEKDPSSFWMYVAAMGSVVMTAAQFLIPGTNNANQTIGVENLDGLLYLGSARAVDLHKHIETDEDEVALEQRVRRWRVITSSLISLGATYTGIRSWLDLTGGEQEPATVTSITLVLGAVAINSLITMKLQPDAHAGTGHGDAWRHAMTDAGVGICMAGALVLSYKSGDSAFAHALPNIAAVGGSLAIFGANVPTPDRINGLSHHPFTRHTHTA